MGNIAIAVEQLGKRYRIAHAAKRPENLRQAIRSSLGAPFHYLRTKLRPPSEDELIWALKDVSFEVKHGEVLGIIGRNGAGKSTLLKILSRITEPTTGQAKVYGRIGSLLEVGTGFHPELTGRENIYLNGTILGMKRAEIDKKFDEIVDFSDVEKFLDTPVKRYSSGMYVRLAFAVAAHLNPEILLVDEVLAVGDAQFQKKCLGKMKRVGQEGKTIFFVSHNMTAILGLCQRCFYFETGKLIRYGETAKIVQGYLNETQNCKSTSLADRIDRQGNGALRVIGIRFLDMETHSQLNNLISGQNICIEVSYKANGSSLNELKNVNIGLPFYNSLGQFVTVFNSIMTDNKFEKLPLEGRVYCDIPRFPLMGGTYSVNVNVYVNGYYADAIENAITVTVQNADYFGTNYPYEHRRQGVYIAHSWRVAR